LQEKVDIRSVLPYIDPSTLNYAEWTCVGMALKDGGYYASDWDDWSRQDSARYHPGECIRKWDTFRGAANPVTCGSIVKMARDHGWRPETEPGYALDWDSAVGDRDDKVIVDQGWLEGREVREPDAWDPVHDLTVYLETLFEAGENVGYVTESWNKDGKYLPTKGCWDRTAGQLIQKLAQCHGDLGSVLGDYNPAAGAWIRFNPLDGNGCKNENVSEFRYALVESDSMELEKQNALIRELELPVACLVYSGGKSLHAIVRIDAANYDEYRKRVDYLYDVLRKNGMAVDTQNKNPSRLSRMPGVTRNGNKQYLVDTNIGKTSWTEWKDWIESVNDDLPNPEGLADVWNNMPDLAPPLIDGVLRQGHKMLLAGPSKAGKSYALIELCCAIAEGRKWMVWQCAQGRVLYVNLELDRASCLHRFRDIYDAMGWKPANIGNIDIWNLRGNSVPMDKLAPKLIRRALKKNYLAIVIDPIYKVITGDENSADQMAHFCNQFDKVCTELGAAVIYCHHHSKGLQGQKRSMDRASGSGVFARDPDAMLDLIELDVTDGLRAQRRDRAACNAAMTYLHRVRMDTEVSQDDALSRRAVLDAAKGLITDREYAELMDGVNAAENAADGCTAWRIDGTLREFPKFSPVNVWFEYPTHRVDADGVLTDLEADGEEPPWKRGVENRKKQAEKHNDSNRVKFENAVNFCNFGEAPTLQQLTESLGKPERTVRNWIKKFGYCIEKRSGRVVKDESPQTENEDCGD